MDNNEQEELGTDSCDATVSGQPVYFARSRHCHTVDFLHYLGNHRDHPDTYRRLGEIRYGYHTAK